MAALLDQVVQMPTMEFVTVVAACAIATEVLAAVMVLVVVEPVVLEAYLRWVVMVLVEQCE